jgi:LexA-binding, inner membrane-associated putative hydrolase
VDPLTHGVASFALQRAFFPRAPWRGVVAIVTAGIALDVDWFTASLGPWDYLRWHRAATHSLVFLSVLVVAAFLFSRFAKNGTWNGLLAPAVAAVTLLHLFLDLCQSEGVAPLWPFSSRRFALDWLPTIEPWLLTTLIAAIALPELFRLVSDEIGARNKRPRGQNGAVIGLAVAALYIGLRALLHANAVTALEARTIAGETPQRAAAFPDATSPFHWHGVVETRSALNLVSMRSMGGEVSYASGITTLHKPEPSLTLTAAQSAPAAVRFLSFARFPKATVQAESEGFSVEIQDLKDQAAETKSRTVFAEIDLDKNSRVVSSALQWQKDLGSSR